MATNEEILKAIKEKNNGDSAITKFLYVGFGVIIAIIWGMITFYFHVTQHIESFHLKERDFNGFKYEIELNLSKANQNFKQLARNVDGVSQKDMNRLSIYKSYPRGSKDNTFNYVPYEQFMAEVKE